MRIQVHKIILPDDKRTLCVVREARISEALCAVCV